MDAIYWTSRVQDQSVLRGFRAARASIPPQFYFDLH